MKHLLQVNFAERHRAPLVPLFADFVGGKTLIS